MHGLKALTCACVYHISLSRNHGHYLFRCNFAAVTIQGVVTIQASSHWALPCCPSYYSLYRTTRCIVLLTRSLRYTVNATIHKGWLLSTCPATDDPMLLVVLLAVSYCKCNDRHQHVQCTLWGMHPVTAILSVCNSRVWLVYFLGSSRRVCGAVTIQRAVTILIGVVIVQLQFKGWLLFNGWFLFKEIQYLCTVFYACIFSPLSP